MTAPSRAFNTAAITLADHLKHTARVNRIGHQRSRGMSSIIIAADALYEVAEMIADGRKLDDPEVDLYRRLAEHHMGVVSAA